MAYARDSGELVPHSCAKKGDFVMIRLLVSLALGALAGWIAGKIMKSSHGLLMNIILGLVGGLILAVVGACILIWLARLISGKKK